MCDCEACLAFHTPIVDLSSRLLVVEKSRCQKRRFRACCGSRVDSLPHTQITVVEFALAIVVCCDYGSREVSLPGVVSSADEIEL